MKRLFGQPSWNLESRQVYAVPLGNGYTGMAAGTDLEPSYKQKVFFKSSNINVVCGHF